MKYDDAGVCFEKGGYAYIMDPGGKAGWVSTNALADWNIPALFAVKDNVFPVKSNITLYSDPLSGSETVGVVENGDTLRILKGNGERFYIVTKKGIKGWIKNIEINNKLNVKKIYWKNLYLNTTNEVSKKFFNKSNTNNIPILFDIDISSINNTNKLFIGKYFNNRLDPDLIFSQNGLEKNITEVLMNGITTIDGKYNKKIGEINYIFKRIINYNYFGFIAVFDIGIPKDYIDLKDKFYEDVTSGKIKINNINNNLNWTGYDIYVDYIKKHDEFSEIFNISLYSRDISLNLITNLNITGKFVFEESLKFINSIDRFYSYISNNHKIIVMSISGNGVLMDPLPYIDERITNNNEKLISMENEWPSINKMKVKKFIITINNNINNNNNCVVYNDNKYKLKKLPDFIYSNTNTILINDHFYKIHEIFNYNIYRSYYINGLYIIFYFYNNKLGYSFYNNGGVLLYNVILENSLDADCYLTDDKIIIKNINSNFTTTYCYSEVFYEY